MTSSKKHVIFFIHCFLSWSKSVSQQSQFGYDFACYRLVLRIKDKSCNNSSRSPLRCPPNSLPQFFSDHQKKNSEAAPDKAAATSVSSEAFSKAVAQVTLPVPTGASGSPWSKSYMNNNWQISILMELLCMFYWGKSKPFSEGILLINI